MPSQIGHSLAGLCGYALVRKGVPSKRRKWFLLVSVVIANLADIDLIFGIISGEYARFHAQATHSLTAVAAVGFASSLIARRWSRNFHLWGVWGGGIYLSHVLLDLLGSKVELFWPFSGAYFGAPFRIFDSWNLFEPLLNLFEPFVSLGFLRKIEMRFSEIVVMTPWVVLAWYTGARLCREKREN